jgi:1-pyrroline-5-carboxylate dehydrogenase
MSGSKVHEVKNLLGGEWVDDKHTETFPDPLTGETFIQVPKSKGETLDAFVASLNSCSKSGLHNPFKSPERYLDYGDVSAAAAARLKEPEVEDFFVKLIQRVAPKSDGQARGEVRVTQRFIENFGGDQVRFLARGFSVAGDHAGQMSHGHRWPYGPTTLITPFNFPFEIPVLQLLGALYMGNKVLMKCDSKVSVVMEQTLRLFHECGMPMSDVDMINCDGPEMHDILMKAKPRMTLFTGSSKVGEMLARDLHGRIKLEDAGFDWKVLGPDVPSDTEFDFVAHTCDQDAYAYSGQKCSAQSVLFAHENWVEKGLFERIAEHASKRNLEELTVGPVLTVTSKAFMKHRDVLLDIPGAKVLFGGKLLKGHSIPEVYGAWEPTAVEVPLSAFLDPKTAALCTTEIFGPFQVVVRYNDEQLDDVLQALENMDAHLTAAVVSNDVNFRNKVLANTVNGTTYAGIRARTTGAPQNHWFGPAGDPRGAGIGSPEAI